jgi:acetyl-CoA C-acetyltransferase
MAAGIRDKVAILGMGCSKFGERWDCGAEELMVEASQEALADAGIDINQIGAAWFATAVPEVHVGNSGAPLSIALRLPNVAVTRVENFCASGSEAFRGAVYAVAAGGLRYRNGARRGEAQRHGFRRVAANRDGNA